jgi:hypothetical protein
MRLGAGLALLSMLAAAPVLAQDSPEAEAAYDAAFVYTFAKACVPQRLSFEGTKEQARLEGWIAVADDAHPELAALLKIARAAAVDPKHPDWKTEFQPFSRELFGEPLYLIVTRLVAPKVINFVGCYLYDFDIDRFIDPLNVEMALRVPFGHKIEGPDLVSYVWGPSPDMPRTHDTYLTLVREGSPHVAQTGFSGLMLKFDTAEPETE